MKRAIAVTLRLLIPLLLLTSCAEPLPTPTAAPTATHTIPTSALELSTPAATATLTGGPSVEAVAWLRSQAIPFKSTEPDDDYSDLAPLKQLVGKARIVSLGEATHGTHEFFTMKHRILRYLVEQMGFSVFAIEDQWTGALQIDEYVQTGKGSAKELVRNNLFSFPWATEEMVDMVEWMRAHNADPGSAMRVSFTGFDMQDPAKAMDMVEAYLSRVDPAAGKRDSPYICFRVQQGDLLQYAQQPAGAKADCRRNLQAAYDNLAANQALYEAKSSPREFAQALHAARIVLQSQEMFAASAYDSINIRDAAMAENVAWLLEQAGPDARIVLWAHNIHVSTTPDAQFTTMGQHLREKYGDQMVTIGFAFYTGSFNAHTITNGAVQGVDVQTAGPSLPDSYEYGFHETGLPRMFLDMRGLRWGAPGPDWLLERHRFHGTIGAAYDPSQPEAQYFSLSLPAAFDLLIYLQDTTPSRVL